MKRRPWLMLLLLLAFLGGGLGFLLVPGPWNESASDRGSTTSDRETPGQANTRSPSLSLTDNPQDDPAGSAAHTPATNSSGSGASPEAAPPATSTDKANVQPSGLQPPLNAGDAPPPSNAGGSPARQPVASLGGTGRRIEHWAGRAVMNSDGSLAVTAGPDRVILWSPDRAEPLWDYQCSRNYMAPAAFTPDGVRVACTDHAGNVVLRATSDGAVVFEHKRVSRAEAVCVHPGGERMFVGYGDGKIIELGIGADATVVELATLDSAAENIYWDAAESRLVMPTESQQVVALRPGSEVEVLYTGDRRVYAIVLREDGRSFVHGSDEGALFLRSISDGAELKAFTPPEEDGAVAPDWGGRDRALIRIRHEAGMSLELWDLATFGPIHKVEVQFTTAVGASADGRRAVTCDLAEEVHFWSLEDGRITPLDKPVIRARFAGWFPDGRTLAVGEVSGRVSIRDAETLAEKDSFQASDKTVEGMCLSPRGDTLVVVDSDRKPTLWTLATRASVVLGARADAFSIQYSPDGALVYLAVDEEIASFDAATGKKIGTVLGTWSVLGFHVNADGTRLVAASGEIRCFNLPVADDGEKVLGEADEVQCIRFSPDGRFIAAGAGNGIWLWDVTASAAAGRIESDCFLIEFRPHGSELLEQNSDGKLARWTTEGLKIETLGGGPAVTTHAAWSPDGRRVLVIGGDQTLHVWDIGD